MNTLPLTFAAALIAAPAFSAPSESLKASAAAFEIQAGEAVSPFILEDSFAHVEECRVLDMKSIRGWSLEEARDLIAPCVKAVSSRYQTRIDVETGFLSTGVPAKTGLLIRTALVAGSKSHRDLVSSVERRGGRLLGHTARVLASGEPAPSAISAPVQSALRRCILPAVVRDIQTGEDFVRIYGSCLLRDEELKIVELRASRGLAVTLKTAQSPNSVESLNGFVTVDAGKGPVSVMMIAYSATVALP